MTRRKYPTAGTAVTPEMLPWCIRYSKAAEVLDLSLRTIEKLVSLGWLPAVSLTDSETSKKRIYYRDLEAYVENQRALYELLPFWERNLHSPNMINKQKLEATLNRLKESEEDVERRVKREARKRMNTIDKDED